MRSLDPRIPDCFYRVSVKAAICDPDGRLLLEEGGDHGWCLPGGGKDHDEDALLALVRELAEEVHGLEDVLVDPVPLAVTFSEADRDGFDGHIPVCFIVYRVSARMSEVRAGEDSRHVSLMSLDDILSARLAHDEREAILQVAREVCN